MAALSPKLKIALGLAVAVAAFSLVTSNGSEDAIETTSLDLPLALFDEGVSTPPTSWSAPPVTRNPFESASLNIDADAVAELATSTTVGTSTAETETASEPAATVPSPQRTVERTPTTRTLEETIDGRIPPGAPPVTTAPVPEGSATTLPGGTTTSAPAGEPSLTN